MKRTLSLFGLAAVLALLMGVSGYAADVKGDTQTHEGTIVSVKDNTFTMTGANNKTHKHTLAPDAKVSVGTQPGKLTDLKPGQKVRVTTKKGDLTTAIRVEILPNKNPAK